MTQRNISLLQNPTHTSTKKKKKPQTPTEIKILRETQSLEKGSLMSYLATGSLCVHD